MPPRAPLFQGAPWGRSPRVRGPGRCPCGSCRACTGRGLDAPEHVDVLDLERLRALITDRHRDLRWPFLRLEVAKGDRSPGQAGEEAGRALASVSSPGADPIEILETEMARRGFEPRRESRGALTELVLERCPFVAAASTDPDIVCEVHRGLAAGILDGLQADQRVRQLVAYNPKGAGCRLHLEARPPASVLPGEDVDLGLVPDGVVTGGLHVEPVVIDEAPAEGGTD